jgi:hypothetical protein
MTPKRMTPSESTTSEEQKTSETTYNAQSKETQNQPQENDTQGTHTLPGWRNADREKNVNQHFQNNDEPENRVTDNANRIKAEDLKKRKIQASF